MSKLLKTVWWLQRLTNLSQLEIHMQATKRCLNLQWFATRLCSNRILWSRTRRRLTTQEQIPSSRSCQEPTYRLTKTSRKTVILTSTGKPEVVQSIRPLATYLNRDVWRSRTHQLPANQLKVCKSTSRLKSSERLVWRPTTRRSHWIEWALTAPSNRIQEPSSNPFNHSLLSRAL